MKKNMLYLVFGLMLSVSNGAMADKTCFDPNIKSKYVPQQYNVADNVDCKEISCEGGGTAANPDTFMVKFTNLTDYMKARCTTDQQKSRCTYKPFLGISGWDSGVIDNCK